MAARTRWSGKVTKTSDAMDVAAGTFKQRSPKKIAEAVEHDAERSTRRKSTPYRSAMSMLTFYLNRGGTNLSAEQREIIERAKEILREEFGPRATAAKKPVRKTAKKPLSKTAKKTSKARAR